MKNEQKLALFELLLGGESSQSDHPFVIGEKVYLRTVTYHLTGRVVAIKGKFITLEDAAWIADSGRFQQAINKGTLSEVEPVDGPVRVNSESIVDAYEWRHELPRVQI